MTIQTNVARRGTVYYHRVAVPKDLRGRIGRRELCRSLRTRSPAHARRLSLIAAQTAHDLFSAVRENDMTKDEIAALIRRFYQRELEVDAMERRSGDAVTLADMAFRRDMFLLPLEKELTEHLAVGQFALVQDFADEIVAPDSVALPPETSSPPTINRTSPEYRELCQGLMRARLEAVKRMIERSKGDYTGQPSDPLLRVPTASAPITTAEKPKKPAPSFEVLLDRFFTEKSDLSPKYVNEFRDSIRMLQEFGGRDKPITAYSEEDIVAYKNALLRTPVNYRKFFRGTTILEAIEANATAGRPTLSLNSINNKRLGNVDSFFEWCRRNKVIPVNPAHEIRVAAPKRGKKKKKRDPFSIEQLNRIFSAPLFTGCRDAWHWKEQGNEIIRNHRYWLPILALWTGARQGELAQLLTSDVKMIENILCISITDDESDDDDIPQHEKRLKNEDSKRDVPVHTELIKLGFLDYVEQQRKTEQFRLFPDCKLGADGSYSPFSKHFRRFLDSRGIKTRQRLVFHSFRHTFQDAMREAEFTDSLQDAIAGRSDEHSRGDYGKGYSVRVKQIAIEKIAYPSLDLSLILRRRHDGS